MQCLGKCFWLCSDEVEVEDMEWVSSRESGMENGEDFGYRTQFSLCHD